MGVACPPAGRTSDQTVLPVFRSIARIRLSVAAAMKISPLAVTTAPPLFGVPMVIGNIEGMPNGPLVRAVPKGRSQIVRSEEHTSELQSLMRISYAVFCLKKKTLQIIRTR